SISNREASFMQPTRDSAGVGIDLRVIGRVRTPFSEAPGTPIQSVFAAGAEGQVTVEAPFAAALDDIEGFERVWLLYWMDRVTSFRPRVVPYRDTRQRGLFATRSPCRPNPIGMSVVRLLQREENVLRVGDVDILDDTPLLDIKPYVPQFDAHPRSKAGWLENCAADREVADGRFHETAERR
ncbi:tRNA (N6-threonylcarbamoyladenosine(37)-N6)-methyltransferase TrmO, partial [Myxococcota bacterium]